MSLPLQYDDQFVDEDWSTFFIEGYEPFVKDCISYLKTHEREYSSLDSYKNNITKSLQIAFNLGMQDMFLQGVKSFYEFLDIRGLFGLAKDLLQRAEQVARLLNDDANLSLALFRLGMIERNYGDYSGAEVYYYQSLSIAKQVRYQEIVRLC